LNATVSGTTGSNHRAYQGSSSGYRQLRYAWVQVQRLRDALAEFGPARCSLGASPTVEKLYCQLAEENAAAIAADNAEQEKEAAIAMQSEKEKEAVLV